MADSVDVILDFLRRNRFTRAEAALLTEINNLPDLNANPQGLELIVKEIECGNGNAHLQATSAPSILFSNTSEEDFLYSRNFNPSTVPVKPSVSQTNEAVDVIAANTNSKSWSVEENAVSMWPASSSKTSVVQSKQPMELDRQLKFNTPSLKVNFTDYPWSRTDDNMNSSSDSAKDCSVKTIFPFSKGDMSSSFGAVTYSDKKEEKKKVEISDTRTSSIKEQVGELGRPIYLVKTPGSSEQKIIGSLSFPLLPENQKEEFPSLPPVKLKSDDKPLVVNWEEKFERDGPTSKLPGADSTLLIGSYLDVPIGQEINPSGMRRATGGSWLSVSQGIAEDTSDLVSGFATVGDGLSESIDYPNEYWDSDEYDDDEDVGYMRQPIEDEAWFLAHEIDYPSDNEKGTGHGSVPDPQERGPAKDEDDDQSFAEEDSYFSGERYLQENNVVPVTTTDDPIGVTLTEYGRTNDNDLMAQYDGQLMDEEELNLMCAEPVWRGFVPQTNELIMLGDGRVLNDNLRSRLEDINMDDDQHGSVRSIGVGINSDAADIGSEVRESLVGGSSEGDLEYFHDRDAGLGGSRHSHHDLDKKSTNKSNKNKNNEKSESNKYVIGCDKDAPLQMKTHGDGNFSFPLSLKDGQMIQASTNKSLWSNNGNADDADDCLSAIVETDDMLALWRRKSSDSSPVKSSRDENNANFVRSTNSSPTTVSNYGYSEREHVKVEEDEKTGIAREDDLGASLEDEEVAAVQEQVRQIKAQEEEFETFNLKIVHRKNRHEAMDKSLKVGEDEWREKERRSTKFCALNEFLLLRTGFEEDKNFHVVLNSVIAGRYHVTEYLGSAAFSKAIQAHDLHTGMDVCVKIIKNNKDFFDQSLDEIKLLKYVNKHDPADKYHILRLYDYFYYRSITIQCLEALQFLHSLGLIHCDLKPENILVKSYSRCEVKVIDLGSSCFETDHLCSYVQSRSYRAPEVILGLPYDKKIDIWSLGCILAELCTGNVLFQNDSPATLLARVIGIIDPIDQSMLAKGRDTYKYFTKNHMLYERNQETNRLEYLVPKKTSLRHRLPMGDQGFIDFVAHLLEVNPKKRPSASEALKHPWLSYPYEPISS
ncbi:DYRK-family kinase pom1 [Glycine max]|nr:DYRK-family kinase pom1 [Glycine max]